jgi:hypothetical protein
MRRAASLALFSIGGGIGLLGLAAQEVSAKAGFADWLRGAYTALAGDAVAAPGGGAAFHATGGAAQFAAFLEEEYSAAPVAPDTIRYRVCKDLSVCYIASRTPVTTIPVASVPPLLFTPPPMYPDVPVATPGTRLGYLASLPLLGLAGYTLIGDGDDGGPGGVENPPPGGQPPPGPGGEEPGGEEPGGEEPGGEEPGGEEPGGEEPGGEEPGGEEPGGENPPPGGENPPPGGENPPPGGENPPPEGEVVPEPMTMALVGTGLAGIAAARRRRRKTAEEEE